MHESEMPTMLNPDDAPVAPDGSFGTGVPVIDLRQESGQRVVDRIGHACADWGFFQIVGHDVPPAFTMDVMRASRRFFARSRNSKRALTRTRDNPWGYYDRELTKNARDKKEIYDIGPDAVGIRGKGEPFAGCTPWPADPQFQSTMRAFFVVCEGLALRLLESVCLTLGAPARCLHEAFRPAHTSFLRLNHYPVEDPLGEHAHGEAALGIHHHTDAGVLTILLQDEVSGLQVYRTGAWHNIAPAKNAFVINLGDMLQVWSNDAYRAPIHRVLAMHQVERFSVPFFFNPSYEAVIAPLTVGIPAASPARYRPLRWGEFRRLRADGDFADYGSEVKISDYLADTAN